MVRAERGVRVIADMAMGGSESDLEDRFNSFVIEEGRIRAGNWRCKEEGRLDALVQEVHLLLLLQFLACLGRSSRSRLLELIARDESATALAFNGRGRNALEVGFKSWVFG